MTAKNIDTKREEFRKYLEKEGVLESLTKALVALYEEPDKPSDALAFVRNNFAATELHTLKAQMENLTQDNEQLKAKVATLEKEKAELLGKVQNLENLQKQNDAAAVESSKPEDVENKEVPEPMEEPKDELKTSEVPAEAATEAQTDVQESSDAPPPAAEVVAEKPEEPKDKDMDETEKPAEASEPEKVTSGEEAKPSEAMETDPPAPESVPEQEKSTES